MQEILRPFPLTPPLSHKGRGELTQVSGLAFIICRVFLLQAAIGVWDLSGSASTLAGMRKIIDRFTLADSGGFVRYDGTELPW